MQAIQNEVEAAFADGRLYLILGEVQPLTRLTADFVGADSYGVKAAGKLRWVHVISKPAGGEIRGYAIVEGENVLRIRLPNYRGDWPELDNAVQERTHATGTVVR